MRLTHLMHYYIDWVYLLIDMTAYTSRHAPSYTIKRQVFFLSKVLNISSQNYTFSFYLYIFSVTNLTVESSRWIVSAAFLTVFVLQVWPITLYHHHSLTIHRIYLYLISYLPFFTHYLTCI